MKPCTNCKAIKPLNDFHKCKSRLDGVKAMCKECIKVESAARYQKNKDKLSQYYKDKYRENPDKYLNRTRKWKKDNPDKHKEYNTKWNIDNIGRKRNVNKIWYENNKQSVSENKKNNRGRYNSYNAKREAAKKQRTPAYANLDIIKDIYEYAAYLTSTTGIEYHVDHIIPLQGKTVSGFHIESNLQVIPKYQNIKKSNIFDSSIGGFYGSCVVDKDAI